MTIAVSTKPETRKQAQRFDSLKRHYQKLALCNKCSAEAAYGHQHGFTEVSPPCDACLMIVCHFPKQESNLWRSVPYGKHSETAISAL